jgi:hypothetical protein
VQNLKFLRLSIQPMRRCPNCNRIYPPSDTYRFCLSDGTSLLTPAETAEAPTLEGKIGDYPTVELKDLPNLNPTLLQMAARVSHEEAIKELRASLYGLAGEGVKHAREEIIVVINRMAEQTKTLTELHPRVKVEFKSIKKTAAALLSELYSVKVSWHQPRANTIDGAELIVLEQRRGRRGRFGKAEDIHTTPFLFDVNSDFQMGWRDQRGNRFYTSEKLAGECLERLMMRLS